MLWSGGRAQKRTTIAPGIRANRQARKKRRKRSSATPMQRHTASKPASTVIVSIYGCVCGVAARELCARPNTHTDFCFPRSMLPLSCAGIRTIPRGSADQSSDDRPYPGPLQDATGSCSPPPSKRACQERHQVARGFAGCKTKVSAPPL